MDNEKTINFQMTTDEAICIGAALEFARSVAMIAQADLVETSLALLQRLNKEFSFKDLLESD